MTLIITSLLAGILTVAAPCILPLLPVVIGGSLHTDPDVSKWRPYIIALSLAISVTLFTLLLKATTVLLGVPTAVWQTISGVIIVLFGLQLLIPHLWEHLSTILKLQSITNNWLQTTNKGTNGWKADALLGMALGPIFNSCSPTYALLVAAILPVSFSLGVVALSMYALGLSGTLLAISLIGQKVLRALRVVSKPNGWFRRGLGVLLILTGAMIIFGLDKSFQVYALDQGWYSAVEDLEETLLSRF
jgi:cytochrome c-type biogenesis protein